MASRGLSASGARDGHNNHCGPWDCVVPGDPGFFAVLLLVFLGGLAAFRSAGHSSPAMRELRKDWEDHGRAPLSCARQPADLQGWEVLIAAARAGLKVVLGLCNLAAVHERFVSLQEREPGQLPNLPHVVTWSEAAMLCFCLVGLAMMQLQRTLTCAWRGQHGDFGLADHLHKVAQGISSLSSFSALNLIMGLNVPAGCQAVAGTHRRVRAAHGGGCWGSVLGGLAALGWGLGLLATGLVGWLALEMRMRELSFVARDPFYDRGWQEIFGRSRREMFLVAAFANNIAGLYDVEGAIQRTVVAVAARREDEGTAQARAEVLRVCLTASLLRRGMPAWKVLLVELTMGAERCAEAVKHLQSEAVKAAEPEAVKAAEAQAV